jgi:tetratricopeptide (TPR) repeat protein
MPRRRRGPRVTTCIRPRSAAFAALAIVLCSASPPAAASSLPVSLLAVPSPDPESGDPLVGLLVEVPGQALVRGGSGETIEGEVWVVARNGEGTVVDAFVQPFAETPPEPGEEPQARSGIKLVGTLRLPPGSYRIQATVSSTGGLTGSAGAALEVPDFAAGTPVISAPLFPEPVERWRVLQRSFSPERPVPAFESLGAGFLPRAVVEVPLNEPVSFHLSGYHVPELGTSLDARLVDLEGNAVPAVARVERQESGTLPGHRWIQATLETQLTEPGVYWLDLGAPGVDRRVQVPLRFVDPAQTPDPLAGSAEVAAGELPAWARPGEGGSGLEGDAADPDPKTAEERASLYREALAAFVSGDTGRGVELLGRLELAAAEDSRRGFEPLRKSQRRVIDELVDRRASLLPVIYLHSLLDPGYLASGSVGLAAQNRVFVADLVERWVKIEGTEEAREVGGLLLASLGASHQALLVDPDSKLALLRLTIDAEKLGQNETALERLSRLLGVAPNDAHARLRLGVVLRRLGRSDEARSQLSALISASSAGAVEAPRWIVGLAHQELAMAERDAGLLRQAETTLRRGIAATGVQALHLQLAFYLDLQQRRVEAEAVLDEVSLADTGSEVAPRHRYNGLPEAELEAARVRLARAVAQRSDELQALLPAGGPATAGSR